MYQPIRHPFLYTKKPHSGGVRKRLEAEATRQRISRTVDELSDRLTVGQVLDEVLGHAKGGGGTMASALTRAARDNPIPSLLVSAGCMMFLSERLGFPPRSAGGEMPSAGSMARKTGASIKQGVRDGTAAAEEGLSAAGEKLGDVWGGKFVSAPPTR